MRIIKKSYFLFLFFIYGLFFTSFALSEDKTMDLNFQHMPLRSVLFYLAKYKSKNIILSSKIKGEVNLNLKKVSWLYAWDAILESHHLVEKNIGNIIYISPLSEMISFEQEFKTWMPQKDLLNVLIPLHYLKADEVLKWIQSQHLLSPQGLATDDRHTNTIFIRDTHYYVDEIQKFIRAIDIAVPQVLIEARIVNVDDDCERELGIRFGLSNMEIVKLNKQMLLDLELSALESEGHAEIISTPRLLTANQQTAIIEAGEDIPYQESVSKGVTSTTFKKAVLKLEVTPQLIGTQKVILDLKVNQDKRSSKEVLGVPAIDTRQLATRVEVENGQTIVLGGIHEYIKTHGVEKIPFLSNLPIIGVLFEHHKWVNTRRELLIFVTPKIV
jgi:type IV pilus assembly protein PilQ